MYFLISSNGFSQTATETLFAESFNNELSEGIEGKALLTGIDFIEEDKKQFLKKSYNANNNIALEKGTVCFWIKPIDWKPDDRKVHIFFEAIGNNSRLLIYKYVGKNNSLGFIFGPLKEIEGKSQWTMANTPIENLQTGTWHFVACSWDQNEIRLYWDGDLKDVAPIKNIPDTPFTSFYVGGRNPEKWTEIGKGITLIDELRIYNVPLPLERIGEEFQKFKDKASRDVEYPIFSVGITKNPPVIDGNIGEKEYFLETTGFLGIWDQRFCSEQSLVYISRSSEKLYIGVRTPVGEKLSANVKNRDDVNVWQDDSIEVHINSRKNNISQFIFNSIGTLYDSKNGDSGWNANINYINKIDNGFWILEMAIPFENLGLLSDEDENNLRFNICRTFASSGAYTSLSPVRRNYGDTVAFSELKFMDKISPMYIKSIGNLSTGYLDFYFQTVATDTTENPLKLRTWITANNQTDTYDGTSHILIKREGIKGNGALTFEALSENSERLFFQKIPFSAQAGNPLKILYFYRLPNSEIIRFGLQQTMLSEAGKYYIVRISFLDKDGKTVFEKEFQPNNFKYELDTDITSIPDGEYAIHINLICPDGRKVYEHIEDFVKYPLCVPWAGNKIGISNKVPSPWTPMETTGNTIYCWGRKYVFDDGIMPSQLISQNESILSGPIRIKAIIDGKEFTDKRKSSLCDEKSPTKIKFHEEGMIGTIAISSDISAEYDGFMWFVINLHTSTPVKVEKLSLNIPFKKSVATLTNLGDFYVKKGTGILPANGISKNLKTEEPVLWVGNEKVGLQWFAENLKNWILKKPESSAGIIPRENDVLLQFNVIDSPTVLEGKTEIAFGLMPTPVKPLSSSWRKLRPSGTGVKRNVAFTIRPVESLITPLFNYIVPAPKNIIKIKDVVNDYKKKGENCLSYSSLAVMSPYCPEFLWQGELWKKVPGARAIQWDNKNIGRENLFVWICPNSPDYRDFYCSITDNAVRELELDGLYFDFGESHMCQNEIHGCGWKDNEGKLCPTFNILGTRELAKRIYILMKTYNPNSLIAYHMSGKIQMPVHSFADILVDGETLTRLVADESSYYNLLPLDTYRAEFMPHQWGVATVILSEFARSAELFKKDMKSFWRSDKAEKPMNHLIGLALIHDSKCFMGDLTRYLQPVRDAQDKFGWDEKVEFLPYWNNSEYLKILSPISTNIVISAFKRDAKLMLVPFNNTDTDNELTIKLDFDMLNIPKSSVVKDTLDGKIYPVNHHIIKVPLKSRAFKILTTE